MAAEAQKGSWGPAGYVAIVLGIGILLGVLVALGAPPRPGPPGPGGGPGPAPPGIARIGYLLSTLDLVLLLSLVFVYTRTYFETRARFALGLVVVLVALAFQTFFASSLLFALFGYGPGGLGPFLVLSYGFAAFALTLFLYLSLD